MTSAISSALSGIIAATTLLDVSAHNTANISTDGFEAQSVHLDENAYGGVKVSIGTNSSPGYAYQGFNGNLVEASNVDVAQEAVSQIIAKHMLALNLASLKATTDAQASLIDIVG